MTTAREIPGFDAERQLAIVRRTVAKKSFCVLATSSAKNRPHAVGILYAAVGLTLYASVSEGTIKVRNIRENPNVAVSIPVRKYLFGPPMAVQFQGTGEVLAVDDPHIRELVEAGQLKRLTAFGGLKTPGACVIKVTPHRRISTYGLGIPLMRLLRNLSRGSRSVEVPQTA